MHISFTGLTLGKWRDNILIVLQVKRSIMDLHIVENVRRFSNLINIKMVSSIKKHELSSKVLDIMADVLKNDKDDK